MDVIAAISGHAKPGGREKRTTARHRHAAACVVGLVFVWLAQVGSGADQAAAQTTRPQLNAIAPNYPLKVSTNRRYLIDSSGISFLIVGDAPQTLINKLSLAEATAYMENRRGYGINSLWINLLCNAMEGCHDDATTFDGIAPFTVANDLSTPNPAYFQRAEALVRIAASNGMVVLLDPIETSGWLGVLRTNGVAKALAYGKFLGSRFGSIPNLIWLHGNDFGTWHDQADDALVQAVARGIRSADTIHLHTVELLWSGSLDDKSWASLIDLDAAYTYLPTYAQVLTEYNRPDFKPVFLIEASYEFEHLPRTDGGSPGNLRRQGYWAILSGAAGQVYGSAVTWRLEPGWQTKLDTPGATHLMYLRQLFASRRWYELVPDQGHSMLIAGYGSMSFHIGRTADYLGTSRGLVIRAFDFLKRKTGFGSIDTNGYAPAAATVDGSLVIAYLPSVRTVTIDMSKLAGPALVSWYDPTNGTYVPVNGSPFSNRGEMRFTPAGNNSAGDGDWVLLLENAPVP
jgi:hypothetical protein